MSGNNLVFFFFSQEWHSKQFPKKPRNWQCPFPNLQHHLLKWGIWQIRTNHVSFHHRIFVTCFSIINHQSQSFHPLIKVLCDTIESLYLHKNVWCFNSNLIYSGLNWQDFFICQDFLIYQQQSISNNSVLRAFYLRWLHIIYKILLFTIL